MDKTILWIMWAIAIVIAAGMKIESSNKEDISIKAFLLHFIPLFLIAIPAGWYIADVEDSVRLYKGQTDRVFPSRKPLALAMG